mgnify:CR=1 FL=1
MVGYPGAGVVAHGPHALSDAELLAIFLRTGVSGKTAVDLARELLQTYGGLRALLDDGRLLMAGPCPAIDAEDPGPAGFSGSVIIAEFDALADARAWAEADPYVAAGVYARVDVRPFRKALP